MISRPTYAGWLVETGAVSRAYGRGWVVESQSAGGADGSAPAATLTGTGAIAGGGASGSSPGTDGTAPAATLTGTASIAGGGASGASSGSFAFAPCENNTQSGALDGIVVNWAWHSGGAVGAADTITNGSGTITSTGMTITGLPTGQGYGVLRTADGTVVAYQEGTVS